MFSKKIGIVTAIAVAFISFYIGMIITANLDVTDKSVAATKDGGDGLWKENGTEKMPEVFAPPFVELAENLSPAVVNISTTQVIKRKNPMHQFRSPLFEDFFGDDFENFFGGRDREYKKQSLGSGFIINDEGFIITNHHVIANATEILVTLSDNNKKEYEAKLIGSDANTDLALIKIETKKELPFVVLGDSDNLKIGEWVMAIGNPFGLGGTVTAGIVSQKGRVIGSGPYDDFIQTDASINPGNSGGPLFNMKGEVVGINTAIIAGGQGIGFAVPVNMAKEIIVQLKDDGKVTRGWIGVAIQEVTPELAKTLGLNKAEGVLISSVMEGDPADKAGLKRRDVIVEFNGTKIKESKDLPRAVAAVKPGKTAKVVVIRDGKRKTFTVSVARKKDGTEDDIKEESKEEDEKIDKLGITIHDITPSISERFGLDTTSGVFVASVEEGSPAEDAGVRKMDVIVEVGGVKVEGKDDYRKLVKKLLSKNIVELLVKRGQNYVYLAVTVGD